MGRLWKDQNRIMARCGNCGTIVLFGGHSWNEIPFCREECRQAAITASYAEDIPNDIVMLQAMTLRDGDCPICGHPGPNDFHSAWSVISLVIFTFHSKKQIFGCNWCGFFHKLRYTVSTGLLGWWGFPWGFLITPLLEIANLLAFARGVPADGPSEELKEMALQQITEELRRRVEDEDEHSPSASGTSVSHQRDFPR